MGKKAKLRARIAELERQLAVPVYESGTTFTETGCNAVLLGDLIRADVRFMGKTYHPSWSVDGGVAKMRCDLGTFSEPTTIAQFDLVSGDTVLATATVPNEHIAAGEGAEIVHAISCEPRLIRCKFL